MEYPKGQSRSCGDKVREWVENHKDNPLQISYTKIVEDSWSDNVWHDLFSDDFDLEFEDDHLDLSEFFSTEYPVTDLSVLEEEDFNNFEEFKLEEEGCSFSSKSRS